MREAKILLAALLSTATAVHGLLFTPESNCQALCSDEKNAGTPRTNTSEIVCKDEDFADSGKGIKFKNCLSCLQTSKTFSSTDSDVHAFLCKLTLIGDTSTKRTLTR